MDMQRLMRLNLRNSISALAQITCISILLVTLVETYFDRSFRTVIYVLFLAYVLLVGVRCKTFIVKKAVLIGLVCNAFYATAYFLIGPGSYLMAPVLTVCVAVPLLYSCMTMMDYDPMELGDAFRKIQFAIYLSLIAELLIAVFGYQPVLESLFPPGVNRPSLFGYIPLHNTFANYFNLNFGGLSSLALISQAYGQFCVMLTIFGIRFLKTPFSFSRFTLLVAIPVAMSIVSPNVTSVVILLSIIVVTILIKAYLNIYSRLHVVGWMFGLPTVLYAVYKADLGFVRTYEADLFYSVYVGPQLDFISKRTLVENLFGADPRVFEDLRQQYEVALLSYMSATGPVFFILNLSVVLYFVYRNLRQIKYLYETGLCTDAYLEAQIMNVLFVVSMLVSTIHYPVIGSYIGSMIFILNVSLGFYFMHTNEKMIRASGADRVSRASAVEPARWSTSG